MLPRLAERRRLATASRPAPAGWAELLDREVVLYRAMPADLRQRLGGLMQLFLAEKHFVGCRGVTVTEPMRLVIAAQACALVLNRPGVPEQGLYPALRSILVYPDEFVVHEEEEDEYGIVTAGHRVLSGQAWDASRIILSWADVTDAGSGYNVVLHEFAHYLDVEDAITERVFEDAGPDRAESSALRSAFEALVEEVDRGVETFLDPYAATDPAEFFAVVTEAFFELPEDLAAHHPQVYASLAAYYRLDPMHWRPAAS